VEKFNDFFVRTNDVERNHGCDMRSLSNREWTEVNRKDGVIQEDMHEILEKNGGIFAELVIFMSYSDWNSDYAGLV
jgi:hypothetical protein